MEIIYNKDSFIQLFTCFEYLINNPTIIHIMNNKIIEKYYIDKDQLKIYKLTNICYCSHYYMDNNVLYINNAISGFEIYILNEQQIYEKLNK